MLTRGPFPFRLLRSAANRIQSSSAGDMHSVTQDNHPKTDANSDSDRNLLFGILALQMDFIGRDGLIAGVHAGFSTSKDH